MPRAKKVLREIAIESESDVSDAEMPTEPVAEPVAEPVKTKKPRKARAPQTPPLTPSPPVVEKKKVSLKKYVLLLVRGLVILVYCIVICVLGV